jgi:hypothetical protein
MADITVPVPDERHAEFFQFFGLWLAGSLNLFPKVVEGSESQSEATEAPKPVSQPWGDTAKDVADAAALWKKLTLRARAMFSLLIDNPGEEFTGQQIADALDIPHGAYGVAGVLGYPGRHAYAIGRPLPTSWREDPETFESFYSMSKENATLFKVAREQVEGTAE